MKHFLLHSFCFTLAGFSFYISPLSMLYIIGLTLVLGLAFGPTLWVRYVLKKYSRPLEGMPGTGGELALHLLEKFKLNDVEVEEADKGVNHYSPAENIIRLESNVYHGKSLTAVATAAHEVGHAIQFNRKEKVSYLRNRYMPTALRLKRYGRMILLVLPLAGIVVKSPALVFLTLAVGIATLLVSVAMYAAILPEEYDASFNKALPILKQGNYVPDTYMPAIRTILKACAYTYVAGALAEAFSLWRWLRFMR